MEIHAACFAMIKLTFGENIRKNDKKPKTNITNLTVFISFKSKKIKKNEIEKNSSAIFAKLKLDN